MDLSPPLSGCFPVVSGIRASLSADAWSGVEKEPSVHAEGLAGDIAGVVGGEEQHGRCDIQVRVAIAAHGYGGDGRRHTLGIGALYFVRGVGLSCRGDDVDGDRIASPLPGGGPRQAAHGFLGDVVPDGPGVPDHAVPGREVDDPACIAQNVPRNPVSNVQSSSVSSNDSSGAGTGRPVGWSRVPQDWALLTRMSRLP